MALLTWKRSYSVGVKALDDQHAILLEFLNELHAASMKGQARSVAGPLLRRLTEFNCVHVRTEEGLMEAAKFPGLTRHRELHRELTGQLLEYSARHEEGDNTVYTPLLRSLYDRFKVHTLIHDMEFGKWLAGPRIR